MINLFLPASNDKSLEYLSMLFGSMSGIIPAPGGGYSGTTITLFGTMFKTFNTIILAVGALIVVYVTVVGIMKTAHEGQFMGKNWNNLWIPIRMVLGIAALVPAPSGYSGLQIIMMWVIVQGIGAADVMWNTALGYVSAVGSPYGQITVPVAGARQAMMSLFQGVTCYKSALATYSNPYGFNKKDGSYYCGMNSSSNWCSANASNPQVFAPDLAYSGASSGYTYKMGPSDSCGVIKYCDPINSCNGAPGSTNAADSLKCTTCTLQIQVLGKDIIPLFAAVAQKYIEVDYQYQLYWVASGLTAANPKLPKIMSAPDFVRQYCSDKGIGPDTCVGGENGNLPKPFGKAGGDEDAKDYMSAPGKTIEDVYWPYALKPVFNGKDEDVVNAAVRLYTGKLNKLVEDYLQTKSNNKTDTSADAAEFQKARNYGWILAGSYYYLLANANRSNLADSLPKLEMARPDAQTMPTAQSSELYLYRNNYDAGQRLANIAAGLGATDSTSDPAGQAGQAASNAASDVISSFFTLISSGFSGVNPLAQMSTFGLQLLYTAQALFITIMVTFTILAIVSNISFLILGSGMATNPAGHMVAEIIFIVYPPIMFMIGIMILAGGLLGIFVPLIPYIIFTIGAVGWLLATIEAMVAGPLVALGILSPSGHHEILGKAEPALMLLFSIFLRPSLMIFGLVGAILLSTIAVMLVNAGFGTALAGIGDMGGKSGGAGSITGAGMFAMIILLCAYVTLIIAVLSKSFAAIHIIPERVMSWLGHHAPGYGEAETLGEVKGAVSAGGAKGTELAKGATPQDKRGAGGGGGGAAPSAPPPPPKKGGDDKSTLGQ